MEGPAAVPSAGQAPLPARRPPGRRSGPAQRAVQRLAAALKRERPDVAVDADGRVARMRDLLVPSALPAAQGSGMLIDRPRTPVDDPLALTANCFLPWSGQESRLRLANLEGFHELRFAARCPTGIRGTPPQTDLLLTGVQDVVGVVTRVTEHLTVPRTKLADGYDHQQREPRLDAWYDLLAQLRRSPGIFRLLDAAGLAKHAIGLAHTFPRRRTALVYLFWEPTDARAFPIFAAHRAEVEMLRRMVTEGAVPLLPMSVRELWDSWRAEAPAGWLRDHLTFLLARYGVAIGD